MPPPDALDADRIAAQLGPAYEAIDATERARHPALTELIATATDIAGESRSLDGDAHAVSIVAPDIPGALSLIAGSLTAQGFDIETADLFTVRRAAPAPRPPPRPGRLGAAGGRPGMPRRPLPPRAPARPSRLLLDRFVVRGTGDRDPWDAIRPGLAEAFALLAGGDAEAAHASIIEGIGRTLPRGRAPARPLYPVAVDVDASSDPAATVLTIAGVDERGFLFEFTNALALLEVSVQRAEVRTEGSESRRHVLGDHARRIEARGPDAPRGAARGGGADPAVHAVAAARARPRAGAAAVQRPRPEPARLPRAAGSRWRRSPTRACSRRWRRRSA